MVENGIGYVTEDRKGEGIIQDMNLRENMTLPSMGLFERFLLLVSSKKKRLQTNTLVNLMLKLPPRKD